MNETKTESLKIEQKQIEIGKWNIRNNRGKEEERVEKMLQQNIEIVGITATNRKSNGCKKNA